MINDILDFRKFQLLFRSTSDEFKAKLAEYDFTYEDIGIYNERSEEKDCYITFRKIKIMDPILINGILGAECEVIFDEDARCVESLRFIITEFSKSNIEKTIKTLNKNLHINIPVTSRYDFLKDRSIYCTPFGQVLLERVTLNRRDDIQITMYFAPVRPAIGTYMLNLDFGPDVLFDGRIFLNKVEINSEAKMSSVFNKLKLNALNPVYTLISVREERNRAMPVWNVSSNSVFIEECGWLEEIFECQIDYDKDTFDKIKSMWLHKRLASKEEANKLYEKLIELISTREGVIEKRKCEKPDYIAKRFAVSRCKGFMIEVGCSKDTVTVAFIYDYWE